MSGPTAARTPDVPDGAGGSWWERHHRQFWLVLAFLVAVTAPFWGGLILVLLFSPSSPFQQP